MSRKISETDGGRAIEQSDLLEPELIFGLVGPLGSNVDATQDALSSELMKVGYTPFLIHVTEDVRKMIPALADILVKTYEDKINLMNRVVQSSGKEDFLARIAIAGIVSRRIALNTSRGHTSRQAQDFQHPKTAYIIRQLKRKQEVSTLQKVYGKKFIQVSIAVGEDEQRQSVLSIIGRERPELSQIQRGEEARKLIARDRE